MGIFIIQESEDILRKNKMFLLISTMVLVVGIVLSLLFIPVYVKDKKPFDYWVGFSKKNKNIYIRFLALEFLKICLILMIAAIIALSFVFAVFNELIIYEKIEKPEKFFTGPVIPKVPYDDVNFQVNQTNLLSFIDDSIEYEIKEKTIMHPVTEFLFFNNYAYILWNFNWLLSLLVCYLFHWTVPFYKRKKVVYSNGSLN
ncbi:hypothetical protein JJE79_02810 [Mycoplasma sp. E35C]|nr:hypothetical protein JJE79_02810 [Mycoplasma sp. E35C]